MSLADLLFWGSPPPLFSALLLKYNFKQIATPQQGKPVLHVVKRKTGQESTVLLAGTHYTLQRKV